MASRKLSQHTAITGANVNPNADYIEILDVSDTTDAASGTNKKILPSQLLIAIGAEPAKGADDNYVTDSEKVVIGNTSGTNTGDNAVNSNYSGLDAAKQNVSEKGAANGYAPLDSGSKIASTYLPSYVNDVLEYANLASFPVTGETGIVYVAIDTGYQYRWSGSIYVEIKDSGETAQTAGALINSATEKTTPIDADFVGLMDSEASNILKKISWANIKANLKTYFDSVTTTLTNKRLTARVQSVTSSATVTPNSDTDDLVIITAQAADLVIANPTGTPTEGQALLIRIKDNGTARAVSFGSEYRAIGITLPTTTVLSKTMYLGCVRNVADTKWDVIGLSQEA